ncbi:MAG: sigma-70 family RNA polymerase sigma factor [Acidobacteria bacterium]|nr:sigma-70 family RNA polymerase sigma factor [Acidobacteriota bacterium]
MPTSSVPGIVEHLFRHQAGQLVSTLTCVFGPQHLELAEEVVQEALIKALQVWPYRGIPENPTAWLVRVAKNSALDVLRRESSLAEKAGVLQQAFAVREALAIRQPMTETSLELIDDELRMMFMACHPAISRESRIALTLKTVGGFGVSEISRAFLSREATIAQRLVRAKRQIKEDGITFELPDSNELSSRLDSVLEVLYLLFNEGYTAHQGENLIRAELCSEAVRFARMLLHHPATNLPKCHALLALMVLLAARLPARVDDNGELFLLRDQDRSLWDKRLIYQGLRHLEQSAAGDELTEYHLQAGIASAHAVALSFEATNWEQIVGLYDQLLELNPSPVIVLNRAVAMAHLQGPEAGISALEAICHHPALHQYYLLPATLGELWRELGDSHQAAHWYRTALKCPCSEPEQRFLRQQLSVLPVSTSFQ